MSFLTSLGGGAVDRLAYLGSLTTQWIKGVSAISVGSAFMGKRGRWNAAILQMFAIGVAALPMVAILGACAGLILAIQSATVLNQSGAVQLVVDIVVSAFTKKLGFLVPAIYLTARFLTNGRLIDEKTGLEQARAMAQ